MVTLSHRQLFALIVRMALASGVGALPAYGQDEIDQPAGDLEEDPAGMDSGDEGMAIDESSEDAIPQMEVSEGAAQDETSEQGADEAAQNSPQTMGPVWESYNDNLKSVAQEVTKGIRVEDVVEPPSEYHYAAFGKRDPFIPEIFASDTPAKIISGLEVPIISILQRYELRELSVVGIWQLSTGERKALVRPGSDKNVQSVIVRNGDVVGKRGGKVLAIGDNYLTVREFKLAQDGTRQYEDTQMLLEQTSQEVDFVPGKIRFTPGGDAPLIIDESAKKIVPSGLSVETSGTPTQQQQQTNVNDARYANGTAGSPGATNPAAKTAPASTDGPAATPVSAPADSASPSDAPSATPAPQNSGLPGPNFPFDQPTAPANGETPSAG